MNGPRLHIWAGRMGKTREILYKKSMVRSSTVMVLQQMIFTAAEQKILGCVLVN